MRQCVDRMYLNVYMPLLQTAGGVAYYLHQICGNPVPSSALLAPRSRPLSWLPLSASSRDHGIDLIRFQRGERKDHRAQDDLRRFSGTEGVLFVGKAQEKARVPRTERRRNANSDSTYPWLMSSTAFVNYYYFYVVDEDFGPCFIKFCSYFPFNAKLCLNGHEYLKRQLTRGGIAFEELDNGILSCADPQRMQQLSDGLTSARIDALLRKWAGRGCATRTAAPTGSPVCSTRWSILQAEFSLTQVLERALHGRAFFEDLIRENLDLGRPRPSAVDLQPPRQQAYAVALSYPRDHPGRVVPSLHVDYKHSRIKQYHKEGRALRTETIINDSYDFDLGRRLDNLDQLKELGYSTNRRLLRVQRLSHDCQVGAAVFADLQQPRVAPDSGQRCAALRFGCARVQALLCALLAFRLLPLGFDNRQLRVQMAPLLGVAGGGLVARPHDLRSTPLAAARSHRPHPALAALPRYRRWHPYRAVLSAHLCPRPAAHLGGGVRSRSTPWQPPQAHRRDLRS